MRNYEFYNYGTRGGLSRWFVNAVRRLLRRLLMPIFRRQVELFQEQDAVIAQMQKRLDYLEGMNIDREAVISTLIRMEQSLEELRTGADHAKSKRAA